MICYLWTGQHICYGKVNQASRMFLTEKITTIKMCFIGDCAEMWSKFQRLWLQQCQTILVANYQSLFSAKFSLVFFPQSNKQQSVWSEDPRSPALLCSVYMSYAISSFSIHAPSTSPPKFQKSPFSNSFILSLDVSTDVSLLIKWSGEKVKLIF